MSGNTVLKYLSLSTMLKTGKPVSICSATENELRKQTEQFKQAITGFVEAVEAYPRELPTDTAKLVLRDSPHKSIGYQRTHFTAVALDKNGNYISTIHVPAIKK